MLLSRGHSIALLWITAMVVYMWPLLTTKSSGDWDFLYIWDDRFNFVENEVLRGTWSFQTLYEMFTMVKINVYEPLGWLLKFLVVQMVGLDAWWLRVVSAIIHFAAGFVLAKVSALVLDIDYVLTELKLPTDAGLKLRTRRTISCLHYHACCMSAVVFLVHPIHVEVVAWPSAQPYTLAALFSYMALLVHVREIHRNLNKMLKDNKTVDSKVFLRSIFDGCTIRNSVLSSVLYLCAMLSKSIAILVPTGFFLVDAWVYLQLSRRPRKTCSRFLTSYATKKLPSIAILLTFVYVTVMSNTEGGVPDAVDLSLSERVLKASTTPVWILQQFLWPSKIRAHYQIHPGNYSLDNPECLLSVALVVLALALTFRNVLHRAVSKHMFTVAFSVSILLPVSGLIRHGSITAGSTRYAYMPTSIFVPYGGWVATHWLLRGTNPGNTKNQLEAPAWGAQERDAPQNSSHLPKQKKYVGNNTLIQAASGKMYAWTMWLLLIGTLLMISKSTLNHWRNEDSLYNFSLRADPADWKILGQRAEYLAHSGRCSSNDPECRNLWTLAYKFSPRGTLKSELYRLHLLIALGDSERACDGYLSLLKSYSDNSSVHNNAAVCLVIRGELTEARREFSRALQTPTIEDTMAKHTTNSRAFDEWLAQRTLHSVDELPGYLGHMTY